jgi:hypothetical protein
MRLYQYAIIHDPKKVDKKSKDPAAIIQDVSSILAEDEKSALIKISRKIPEVFLDKLGEVEIYIRPF